MSQKNVEIVRGIYEGLPLVLDSLRTGSFEFGYPFAEDVEWDASEMGLPDAGEGVFRGHDGVRHFWMAWLAPWEDVRFEYTLREAGDRVVALCDQWMRGSADVTVASGRYAQVWTFEDGLVTHWRAYRDATLALTSAGLAE